MEICYVVRPSTCPDLMESSYFRFHQYSEEACRMKNRTENTSEHKARQTLVNDSTSEYNSLQTLINDHTDEGETKF